MTEAALDELKEWQDRPLDPPYPLVIFDALRVKICGGGTRRRIWRWDTRSGMNEALGIWVERNVDRIQAWRGGIEVPPRRSALGPIAGRLELGVQVLRDDRRERHSWGIASRSCVCTPKCTPASRGLGRYRVESVVTS